MNRTELYEPPMVSMQIFSSSGNLSRPLRRSYLVVAVEDVLRTHACWKSF